MFTEDLSWLKIFISYSSKDKELAGDIKRFLTSQGFLVFLAHEDIEPNTAQPNLAAQDVKFYYVPLPPISEQKRIVEKVDTLMKLCDELSKNIDENRKNSNLLMETVLKEAFV